MDYIETFTDKPEVVFDATCFECGEVETFKVEICFETMLGWKFYDNAMSLAGWKMKPDASDRWSCPNCK